jgi:ribosomal protein L19E
LFWIWERRRKGRRRGKGEREGEVDAYLDQKAAPQATGLARARSKPL